MPDPWFVPEAGGLRSTGVAVSPHAPDAQNGAAVAGLVARAADMMPSDVPMDISRITVDLTRVVPLGLVTVDTEVRRAGRRVQMIDVIVSVDGEPRTRSEVLRVARSDIVAADELPPVPDDDLLPEVPPHERPVARPWLTSPMLDGIDISFEAYSPGRAVYSIRLTDQLVAGEHMTPATKAAVAADLVLTAGGLVPEYSMVNADVLLGMSRLPVGDVIRIASSVRVNRSWGSSAGVLYDDDGQFATVIKSLLVLGRRP